MYTALTVLSGLIFYGVFLLLPAAAVLYTMVKDKSE
jgi:hypothetical protein